MQKRDGMIRKVTALGGNLANCPVKSLKNKDLAICQPVRDDGKVARSFPATFERQQGRIYLGRWGWRGFFRSHLFPYILSTRRSAVGGAYCTDSEPARGRAK